MTDPSTRLAALGVVLATFIATPASAGEPPSPPAAKPAAAADGKAKPADAKAAKPEKAADKAADKGADKADKAADKAADKGADKGAKLEDKAAEGAKPEGKAHGEFRSGWQQLREDLRDGKVKKEEVADRLAKLKETQKDRRKEHREALKEHWGDALAKPNALEELRHHARRLAYLDRALLLAETERKGKDKEKLVERIQKLVEKENARHESAMERIKSGQGAVAAATASGATSPAVAAPGGKPDTAPAAAKASAATPSPAVPAAAGSTKGGAQ